MRIEALSDEELDREVIAEGMDPKELDRRNALLATFFNDPIGLGQTSSRGASGVTAEEGEPALTGKSAEREPARQQGQGKRSSAEDLEALERMRDEDASVANAMGQLLGVPADHIEALCGETAPIVFLSTILVDRVKQRGAGNATAEGIGPTKEAAWAVWLKWMYVWLYPESDRTRSETGERIHRMLSDAGYDAETLGRQAQKTAALANEELVARGRARADEMRLRRQERARKLPS